MQLELAPSFPSTRFSFLLPRSSGPDLSSKTAPSIPCFARQVPRSATTAGTDYFGGVTQALRQAS